MIDLSEGGDLWAKAQMLYAEGRRGYHKFEHAVDVLKRVDKFQEQLGFMHYDSARLAALFHDAIYVPGDINNERRSAIEMKRCLKSVPQSPTLFRSMLAIELAFDLIEATAFHMEPINPRDQWDRALFMDCDVLGFAAEESDFKKQNDDIAYEFSHVEPDKYRAGRIKFLTSLHERGVFRTPPIQREYEEKAKHNIRVSLRELGVVL